MEKRTITVEGKSVKRVPPDTIELSFTVKAIDMDYSKMMNNANNQLSTMQGIVEEAGFEKKELRTKKYDINPIYRSVQNKDGEYESIFAGYECRQDFLLKFPIDMQLLHKLLRSVDLCNVKPEFEIIFTLRNSQAVRDQALQEAAINAKREASIVVGAIDAKLGALSNVRISNNSYSRSIIGITASTSLRPSSDCISMQPDTIAVEASAEFIWEIVNN